MRSIGIALVLVALVLTSSPRAAAQVQTPGPPATQITLAEALEQAIARNRDLAVSRRDVDVSRGRLRQARRYPFNPELVVEGEGGRGVGREDGDRRGVGGGKIGLSQVIEVRGQRGLRIRAAASEVSRTEWGSRETEREVVAEATRGFSDLLLAQERVGLAREASTLATGLRDTARKLVDVGDVPEIDLLRAEVEVRRALNRVRQEEAVVQAAVRNLALLVGAPADATLLATGPLLLDPVPGTVEELSHRARSDRPDLKAADAAIESARAALALIEADRFLPSITLSAGYGEALDFDSRNRLALFGVSLPLPFWNRRDGDLEAARAEIAKQEAERARVLARIDKEVATAFGQFVSARQVVEDYVKQILPAQEQNVGLVEQGYRGGQLRLTEALLAQRDLIDVRTGYFEAVASYNAARVELEKATGVRP